MSAEVISEVLHWWTWVGLAAALLLMWMSPHSGATPNRKQVVFLVLLFGPFAWVTAALILAFALPIWVYGKLGEKP